MPIGRPARLQRGVGYLALLFAVAIGSVALAGEKVLWSVERQREREQELLFVGDQFRQAIRSYYEASPGAVKRYPPTLHDLLEDVRVPGIRRHLRKLYADPITETPAWGLVLAPDGGVMGVFSPSRSTPLKQSGFGERDSEFENQRIYQNWVFLYRGEQTRFMPAQMLRYVAPPP